MLVVGGENLIDLVQIGMEDALPLYSANPGGSPFNVAMAAGRQGLPVSYLTPISTDSSGDLLANRLTDSHVIMASDRHSAPSSMAVVSLADGIPTYSFYREGTAERHVTSDMLKSQLPADAKIFHIGSLGLAGGDDAEAWEAFAAYCKEANLCVSLDPNVRASLIADPKSYRDRIARLMGLADIVKLSDEDLDWLHEGKSETAALQELIKTTSASIVVLTRGGEGASIWHEGSWTDIKAKAVSELKDTVGAGDTFMATMLVWLAGSGQLSDLSSLSLADKMQMVEKAAKAAAINCGRQGCNPPWKDEL